MNESSGLPQKRVDSWNNLFLSSKTSVHMCSGIHFVFCFEYMVVEFGGEYSEDCKVELEERRKKTIKRGTVFFSLQVSANN